MQKLCITLLLSITLFLSFSFLCKAEPLTNISNLVEESKTLDKKVIIVRGEAVGEKMKRGEYTWINIGDGSAALGIWMKNDDADKIHTLGSYRHKGDIVEVRGLLSRACSEHGGDFDVHAETVKVIEVGFLTLEGVDQGKIEKAVLLSFITLILAIIRYKSKIQRYFRHRKHKVAEE